MAAIATFNGLNAVKSSGAEKGGPATAQIAMSDGPAPYGYSVVVASAFPVPEHRQEEAAAAHRAAGGLAALRGPEREAVRPHGCPGPHAAPGGVAGQGCALAHGEPKAVRHDG